MYDDMMGLEMYDGLDGLFDPAFLKDLLIAGTGAAVAIGGAGKALRMVTVEGWDPKNVVRLRSGLGIVAGVGLAKLVYPYQRDAAMAIFGALAGVSLVELVGTFMDMSGFKPGLSALPEDLELRAIEDQSLAAGQYNEEMAALADLSAPMVAAARGAFGDPSVTRAPLEAAVVQGETLGWGGFADDAYQPWNA